MDAQTGKWMPCGRGDGETPEFNVTGLEPGHKYNFRVRAVSLDFLNDS